MEQRCPAWVSIKRLRGALPRAGDDDHQGVTRPPRAVDDLLNDRGYVGGLLSRAGLTYRRPRHRTPRHEARRRAPR